MRGMTAVYVVFAIVLAALFGYLYLLSRRQRELESDLQELRLNVQDSASVAVKK